MIKKLNKKRVLSLVLALVLMVGSFSMSAFAYEEEAVDFFSESAIDFTSADDEQLQDEIVNEPNGESSNENDTTVELEEDTQVEETLNENIEAIDEYDSFAIFSYEEIIAHRSVNVNFAQREFIQFPASWIRSGWSPWGTGIFTLTIGGNTTLAYCVQPRLPAPTTGEYVASVLAQNSALSNALYYMWGAPGQNELFTTQRRANLPNTGSTNIPGIGSVQNTEYVLSHLIVSYLYSGRNPNASVMQPASPVAIAVVRQWVAWLDALPAPPYANKSFSNPNLTASLDLTAGRQYTPWTTFQADHRNSITVPAPTGAQVQVRNANGSGASAWANSATVNGAQQFRFRSNTLSSVPSGRWTSPALHGSINMQWRALLMERPASEQNIGGWGAVDDPVTPIRFTIDWQEALGSLRIIKTVEHWSTRAGFEFEVRRVRDNHLVGRFTSPASGEIYIPELVAGGYSILEIVPYGFIAPTPNPRTVTVVAGQVGTAAPSTTFHNVRQRATLEIIKSDAETGDRPQGDAQLDNGVFAIYNAAGQRVQTLGSSELSQILDLGVYYVVEIEPPTGYTLNETRHRVVLTATNNHEAIFAHTVEVHNEVIRGRVALIKFTDATSGNLQIRPPLEGTIFEVWLRSAGSFEDALPTERDRITTDRNGFAQTNWLPYGWYVVEEVYAPGDVRLVDRFHVYIDSDGQTHFFILENPEFQSRVRIVKLDATTGERIPTAGVAFRVKDLATGEWVSQTFNYPTPTTIDIFHTNEEGWLVMPQPLRSGEYELHEIHAPYGYLLSKDPVPFTIHSDYDNEENMIEVRMYNEPAMGIISIEKVCEITDHRLSDATFEVIAAEDIITPDGTVRVHVGEIVDTITTDEDGLAKSTPLFLGNYHLIEIEAPHGFLLDPTPILVTLTYENQYVTIVTEFVTIENIPIKGIVTIEKVCEETGEHLEGAVFHIYDEEGDLADVIITDNDGLATSRELPLGDYVVIEMYAPEGFIINGASHDVTLSWESQYVAIVHKFITVENQPIQGNIRIIKVCAESGERLAGAVFALYQDDVRIAEATSCDEGYAYFHDIPFGEFEIREIRAPKGFVLSDKVFVVNISEHEETIEITVENHRKPNEPIPAPQTGDDTQLPWVRLIFAGLGIISIGIGLVVLNVKKNKEN